MKPGDSATSDAFEEPDTAVESSGARGLAEDYLRAIARVEASDGNRDGSDKSWLHRLVAWSDRHHARARAE